MQEVALGVSEIYRGVESGLIIGVCAPWLWSRRVSNSLSKDLRLIQMQCGEIRSLKEPVSLVDLCLTFRCARSVPPRLGPKTLLCLQISSRLDGNFAETLMREMCFPIYAPWESRGGKTFSCKLFRNKPSPAESQLLRQKIVTHWLASHAFWERCRTPSPAPTPATCNMLQR